MGFMKKVIAIILATILAIGMLTGCTPVAPNTVFSIDDLPGIESIYCRV